MTGIERLRELVDGIIPSIAVCGVTKISYDMKHGETAGVRLRVFLANIADQIAREHAEDCRRMGLDHGAVSRVVADMERHVLGHEGMEDSPVARWARELREALGAKPHDPAKDVSMSAYDLLPQEERDAIEWVREHGGIAYVKDAWNVRSNLDRQLETAQAKVERQQRHIEFVQRKCRERRERIEELSRELDELADICDGESVRDTLEEALNLCATIGCEPSSAVGEELVWALGECTKIVGKRLMPEGMELDGNVLKIWTAENVDYDGKTLFVLIGGCDE